MQDNITSVVHHICSWELDTGNEVFYAVLQLVGIIILFTGECYHGYHGYHGYHAMVTMLVTVVTVVIKCCMLCCN